MRVVVEKINRGQAVFPPIPPKNRGFHFNIVPCRIGGKYAETLSHADRFTFRSPAPPSPPRASVASASAPSRQKQSRGGSSPAWPVASRRPSVAGVGRIVVGVCTVESRHDE